jgi:nucleoside-diphosphate-sugar epimerase
MTDGKTALILGATGGVGHETALALAARGWKVRALHRRPEQARSTSPQADWIAGDAMNQADVIAAGRGAALIFHGVNPPGYRNWRGLALPMLDNTIAAARAVGARIVFPGTVYNYGPDAFPLLSETSPQKPRTRKGAIRVDMERRLEEAARRGPRVLIVRGGDFFGPHTGNSWFSQGLVKPGKPLRSITYPGRRGVGHAWAYLPDFAAAIARLVDYEGPLESFETFHFGGHWFERGEEIAERIRAVAGDERIPIRAFPWMLLLALSPFVRLFREMAEMRYLWTTPVRLDNAKLVRALGEEPHTEINAALRRTLTALGCLPDES